MITVRASDERGHVNIGWLDSKHTFSFDQYYDPRHMQFRSLRVINEDVVAPGRGFGKHPHRDMEILTYVLEGALQHGDSMGNGSVIRPGDVQKMSAGTGVVHSEFNASEAEPVHLLQIWIMPKSRGINPSYHEHHFDDAALRNQLRAIASENGNAEIPVHQDATIYASRLDAGASVTHALAPGRGAWLQLARGEVKLNGQTLRAGDGAAVMDEAELTIEAVSSAEFLLFDLN